MKDEIRKLNEEIYDLEDTVLSEKINFETKKAELWLGTDFQTILGKAKPTQKDIENWIKLELAKKEEDYKQLENVLKMKKRLFEIMLKELGDE